MKVNSPRALELGRQLYDRLDGDWSRVREHGVQRSDGVLVVRMPRSTATEPDRSKGPVAAPPRKG